jgi:ABC-2 type transport system ATP-binding protein
MTDAAIECVSLFKRYGALAAVDGIDLTVPRGSCFGLLGPNGAGKTTTVEMLEGLTSPTSGAIRLFGLEWKRSTEQQLRERIGVQLQETVLADKLLVEELIVLFRSFYQRGRDPEAVIEMLSLEACRKQQYTKLSGGQRQRVAVACALVGQPELLFLDEPTTGLDPRARQQLWSVIRDFRAAGGTVVLTTHYMEEAAALCDSLAVMDHGRIIAQGTPRELVDRLGDVQFLEFDTSNGFDVSGLEALPVVRSVRRSGLKCRVELDRQMVALSQVLTTLESLQVVPIGLSAHQATLDDVFLQLTGHSLQQDSSSNTSGTAGAANE